MKQIIILISLLCWCIIVQAQIVTLEMCLENAVKNSPLNKQSELYSGLSLLQQKNNMNGKLPQLNLNGQVTYQSTVTELAIKVPGFNAPEIPKLQYKSTLDATQLIYGGRMIEYVNDIELLNLHLSQLSSETDLYQIKEKVNLLYFGILLADANLNVIEQTNTDLNARLERLQSGERNGIVLPSSVQVIKAEILKAGQRVTEIAAGKKALIATLGIFTGLPLTQETVFAQPKTEIKLSGFINNRPEYRQFDVIIGKLQASEKLITARDMPKVYGFGTVGFGRPGLNMFKEEADFFYISGIRLSWNIYNWHQSERERKSIQLNTSIIENKKAAYDMANRSIIEQYLSDIDKSVELLKSDIEIIQLRESIKNAAASQLENGFIAASDYVTEQIALEQAQLQKNFHQIQQLQAKWLYKAATGDL